MTTKNAKDAAAANMFMLGGPAKEKAAPKAKAAAKEKAAVAAPKAAAKSKQKFDIYYNGEVQETITSANLAAAQKKADNDWAERVLAVPADADAAAVKVAIRASKKLTKDEEAEAKAPKQRGRARIERSAEEEDERHEAHLIRKRARRKCRSWMRANEVTAVANIVVQPVDDSFVFAVETEKKTIYLGLDEDGEIMNIKAAAFKEAQAAAE